MKLKTMRILLVIKIVVLSTFSLFGQFDEREKLIMDIVNNQDTISRSLFLDSTDFKNFKLTYAGNTRQIWRSKSKETQNIEQFYDIRIKFDSKEKALAFHKEFWKENSEFGSEIKKHKIKTKGTDGFSVFNGNEVVNHMLAAYGIRHYCFIFVIDSYFVKFYISCKKELEPTIIQPYLDKVKEKIKN